MQTKQAFKKIERFFLSRRTAVGLLVLTLVPLIVATRQRRIVEVTTSPFFLILPAFIFLSVLLCTLSRLKTRKVRRPHHSSFTIKRSITVPLEDNPIESISGYLRRKGWSIFERDGEGIVYNKGGGGFWGSMVFHAGLLLLLISSAVTASTLFGAEILLTQGLPTPLGREGLLNVWREPLIPVRLPAGMATMERFEAVFEEGRFPVDYAATLKIMDERGERGVETRVNDPLILEGIQYTMDRYGFAPGFKVEDALGDMVFDGYVSIMNYLAEDFFEIPGTSDKVYVRFFPDFEMKESGPATRSRIVKNPVFGVRVVDGKGREPERGKLIRLGRSARIGQYTVSPYEVRYWAHFGLTRDYGLPLIIVSLVAMVTGLVMRFAWYEKWLMLAWKDGGLEISGYSRYFPALFEEEVERVAEGLLLADEGTGPLE